jgi:hypothetical protein
VKDVWDDATEFPLNRVRVRALGFEVRPQLSGEGEGTRLVVLRRAGLEDYEGGRDCLGADVLRELALAYGVGVGELYLEAGVLTAKDLDAFRSRG